MGIEQANASQHLAVLRSKQIVLNREEGNQVFYSLRDPILGDVLDLMRRYFEAHISLPDVGKPNDPRKIEVSENHSRSRPTRTANIVEFEHWLSFAAGCQD